MNSGIFVTGTDTDVGKTLVSTALVRRLLQMHCSVGVMKPVETGVRSDSLDGQRRRSIDSRGGSGRYTRSRMSLPLPPPARSIRGCVRGGTQHRVAGILRQFQRLAARYSCMVVEGAGGLLVPMGQDWSLRELIVRLSLPVVLVGRIGLGGINHALLTLESLQREHIRVIALLLNETRPSTTTAQQQQTASTVSLLRARAGVPVLGPIPYQAQLNHDWSGTIELVAQSLPIMDLADLAWRAIAESSG